MGFCILMGIHKLPDLYDYWSTDDALHYSLIASKLSRKHFMEIKSFLHFVDKDTISKRGEPGYDRLARISFILLTTSLFTILTER